MRDAVDSLSCPSRTTALWDYLERAAYFMVNSMDASPDGLGSLIG
jgi:hemoglobin